MLSGLPWKGQRSSRPQPRQIWTSYSHLYVVRSLHRASEAVHRGSDRLWTHGAGICAQRMQPANGDPPLPSLRSTQQTGCTRNLLLTASVCLLSLVAVAALSGGRRLLSGTPLVLSSQAAASAVDLPLDHYDDAVQRAHAAAAQSMQAGTETPASDAAAVAGGPSIQQMASEMTARALAMSAADPSRVQLLPQVGSLRRAEPPAFAGAAGSGDLAAAIEDVSAPDVAVGAVSVGGAASQPQLSTSANLPEAGTVNAVEVDADAMFVKVRQADMAVQSGAQAGSAPSDGQPSLDAAEASQASAGSQTVAQERPVATLGGQALTPGDVQSALAAAAFAEGVIASRSASAEDKNPPATAAER